MIAGIDTILLTSKDYQVTANIKDLASLGWGASGNPLNEDKVLVRDKSGNDLRAKKIYNNAKIGHYDISPFGVLVHFNPSKAYHVYNLISTGKDLKYLTNEIQKEAKSIGIDVSIDNAFLSRLDLTKQNTMKRDVSQYASAFRLLQAKRANKKEYPSGYYFHNKKRECIFYDKAIEAKIDEVNFMRGEVKFKDTKTTQSATKIISMSDLNSATPDYLTDVYNTHLKDRVFVRKNLGMQSVIDFNNEIEIMKVFFNRNKRGAWKEYLCQFSIDEVLNQFGSVEKFVECWAEAGYQRRQIFVMKNQIRQMIHEKSFLDNRRNKINASALLDEVYQKFAV